MRTDFEPEFLATDKGARANEILRACVHCGFCNATCPTYQLLGDELDGPRGRIYLIRDLLQTGANQERATVHLDRCLTCRACETTCPSGVAYGELADIAREQLGVDRSGVRGLQRVMLKWVVPYPARLRPLAWLGSWFRWMLPRSLANNLPARVGRALRIEASAQAAPNGRVLVLNGCAQQVNTAETNRHLAQLLQRHGVAVETQRGEVCCGSLDLHLGDVERAKAFARRNVDVLHPRLAEVDAILSAASGCGVTTKDYGRLLAADDEYAAKAAEVAARTKDVSEYLQGLDVNFTAARPGSTVAWHSPCSLQHGHKITGLVEPLLEAAGYQLSQVPDAHLCCGSAGTYSVLQPQLSEQLKANKLAALTSGAPDLIATANVGCQTHLEADSGVPVLHWIELLQ